eukprot:7382331-Prymnesium_polylepis.1
MAREAAARVEERRLHQRRPLIADDERVSIRGGRVVEVDVLVPKHLATSEWRDAKDGCGVPVGLVRREPMRAAHERPHERLCHAEVDPVLVARGSAAKVVDSTDANPTAAVSSPGSIQPEVRLLTITGKPFALKSRSKSSGVKSGKARRSTSHGGSASSACTAGRGGQAGRSAVRSGARYVSSQRSKRAPSASSQWTMSWASTSRARSR